MVPYLYTFVHQFHFPLLERNLKYNTSFKKTQFEHDWQRIINLRRIIKTPEFEVSVYATPNWSLERQLPETEKWQITLKYGCLGHSKKHIVGWGNSQPCTVHKGIRKPRRRAKRVLSKSIECPTPTIFRSGRPAKQSPSSYPTQLEGLRGDINIWQIKHPAGLNVYLFN